MTDATELGWDDTAGLELDHRRLKAPSVKLRSITVGSHGDAVYCVDLRICKPNEEILPITVLHSFEHFLLEGLQKYLPENFISIGLMGCQTGFYLVLLNEGRADTICQVLENILSDVLKASEVPYTTIEQCGNFQNHSLEQAQALAKRLMEGEGRWRQVV